MNYESIENVIINFSDQLQSDRRIQLILTGTESGGGLVGSVAAVIHAVAEQIRLDAEFVLSAPEVLAGVLCEITESSFLITLACCHARIAINNGTVLGTISENSISSCT